MASMYRQGKACILPGQADLDSGQERTQRTGQPMKLLIPDWLDPDRNICSLPKLY